MRLALPLDRAPVELQSIASVKTFSIRQQNSVGSVRHRGREMSSLEPQLHHLPQPPQFLQPTTRRPPSLPDSIRHLTFNAPPAPPPVERLEFPEFHGQFEAADPSSAYPGEETLGTLALSPIVLAVTVDGHVHGIQRTTGQWLWTLHDDGGAGAGPSSGGAGSSRLEGTNPLVSPLVRSRTRRTTPSTSSGRLSNDTGLSAPDVVDEEMYVIEPAGQGAIYLYTKSDGAIQKLPLTMQELVNLEAFTFPTDDSRMFVGRKESKLVGVDLRTGRLVGVFGNGNGWCEWDPDQDGADDRVRTEECDEQIQRRPEDLLYMAKTGKHPCCECDRRSSLAHTGAEPVYLLICRVSPLCLLENLLCPSSTTYLHHVRLLQRLPALDPVDRHPRRPLPPALLRRNPDRLQNWRALVRVEDTL